MLMSAELHDCREALAAAALAVERLQQRAAADVDAEPPRSTNSALLEQVEDLQHQLRVAMHRLIPIVRCVTVTHTCSPDSRLTNCMQQTQTHELARIRERSQGYSTHQGKRRKLSPAASQDSATADDRVWIKPEPIGSPPKPSIMVTSEPAFASTEEMLEQVYLSDVAILRRLSDASHAIAVRVCACATHAQRVAGLPELVASALQMLAFVQSLGADVFFRRDASDLLVNMETSVSTITDVLEATETSDERVATATALLQMIEPLVSDHHSLRTVFTRCVRLEMAIVCCVGHSLSSRSLQCPQSPPRAAVQQRGCARGAARPVDGARRPLCVHPEPREDAV